MATVTPGCCFRYGAINWSSYTALLVGRPSQVASRSDAGLAVTEAVLEMALRTVGLVWAVLETLAVAVDDEAGAATVLAVVAGAAADEFAEPVALVLALLVVLVPQAACRATAKPAAPARMVRRGSRRKEEGNEECSGIIAMRVLLEPSTLAAASAAAGKRLPSNTASFY